MRCKKHISDHSSRVGVCSSCLRERLIALIAAQALIDPPPLVFPRSVSPYVSRRKSDDTAPSTCALFYSTPQVTLTTTGHFPVTKRSGKFSLISNLFKSRSDNYNSNCRVGCRNSTVPSTSSSWFFSAIFPSRRKKKSTLCYADDSTANGRRGRGISPARETESDDDWDRSPWGNSVSTDEWRRTPMAAVPGVRRTLGKNASGLAFCLSPLVRASPNRHWIQKGGALGYSGEGRSTVKPHLSTAASYCANRSRKLADFGRVNDNRRG